MQERGHEHLPNTHFDSVGRISPLTERRRAIDILEDAIDHLLSESTPERDCSARNNGELSDRVLTSLKELGSTAGSTRQGTSVAAIRKSLLTIAEQTFFDRT
jgi:hypothetical protein